MRYSREFVHFLHFVILLNYLLNLFYSENESRFRQRVSRIRKFIGTMRNSYQGDRTGGSCDNHGRQSFQIAFHMAVSRVIVLFFCTDCVIINDLKQKLQYKIFGRLQMRSASRPGVYNQKIHIFQERHISHVALSLCRRIMQHSDAYCHNSRFHQVAGIIHHRFWRYRNKI